jgi:hypothetical protein
MKEIDFDINKIAILTTKNIGLGPQRLDRERRKDSKVWSNIQTHAREIYETLANQLPSHCSCKHQHRADLRLEVREDQENAKSSMRFRCLFSIDPNDSVTSPMPWNWREVDIEPRQTGNSGVQ